MVGAAAEELVVVLENDDLYIGNVLFGKLKNVFVKIRTIRPNKSNLTNGNIKYSEPLVKKKY